MGSQPCASWLQEQAEMHEPAARGAWAFMAPAGPLEEQCGLGAAERSASGFSSNSDDTYASSAPLPRTNGSSASCSSLDAMLDEKQPVKVFVMLPLDAVGARHPQPS
jgi:hypothetical protein